jgi:hypothetical protein
MTLLVLASLSMSNPAMAAVACSGPSATLSVQNDVNGFVPMGQQLALSITVRSPSNGILIFIDSSNSLYGNLSAGLNTIGIPQPVYVPLPASGAHVVWIASLDQGFYPNTECAISFNVGTGPNVPQFPDETPVYRFYNGRHHFFTLSYNEGINAGFRFERVGFFVWNRQLDPAMVPLYRCYSPRADDHFISARSDCEGYVNEGAYGWVFPATWDHRTTAPGDPARVPLFGTGQLFRFFSGKNDHLVTLDLRENLSGWVNEGFVGYVPLPMIMW